MPEQRRMAPTPDVRQYEYRPSGAFGCDIARDVAADHFSLMPDGIGTWKSRNDEDFQIVVARFFFTLLMY